MDRSRRPSVPAHTAVLFIYYEFQDFLFVRFVFRNPCKRSEKIRRQMVRHTVMYGQVDKIFGCFKGFDVSMALKEFLSSVNDDKSSAYLNNDILAFRIHLISQAERPSNLSDM